MSSDPDTEHAGPSSRPEDDVYTENEAGEPRMAGQSGDNEGVYGGFPDDSARVVDPKVYGLILLVGAVLLVFPEPVTSTVGIALLVVGGFVAAIDLLTA